jgi:serine/threonine-protein kinase
VKAAIFEEANRGPQDVSFGPRYTLLEELGRGGMGIVNRARFCPVPGGAAIDAALKRIRHDRLTTDMIESFENEMNTIVGLEHSHIVRVRDWGRENGQLFYAMDLVRGGNLAELVARVKPLPARVAARLICQVAGAVHFVHERGQGLYHRDIKPSNILLGSRSREHQGPPSLKDLEGGDCTPLLSDFGLALPAQDSKRETGRPVGSPQYMAPEQASGNVGLFDRRSDVYGLVA